MVTVPNTYMYGNADLISNGDRIKFVFEMPTVEFDLLEYGLR